MSSLSLPFPLFFSSLLSPSLTTSLCPISILPPHYTTSVANPASSLRPQFRDPPPFPISCYLRECASYLDAWRFTDMHSSDPALTIRDRQNILCDSDVG